MTPAWLPRLLDTDGDWQAVVARLYAAFCADFGAGNLTLNGLPVGCDMRHCEDGKEEAFWHLITGLDRDSGQRLFESERARRLLWCGAVIRNPGDGAVLQWQYREKGALRTYLWLQHEDYVVVLQGAPSRRPQRYILLTAFHLSGESQRRNMRRRYENREA
jgi:hypothetical protein